MKGGMIRTRHLHTTSCGAINWRVAAFAPLSNLVHSTTTQATHAGLQDSGRLEGQSRGHGGRTQRVVLGRRAAAERDAHVLRTAGRPGDGTVVAATALTTATLTTATLTTAALTSSALTATTLTTASLTATALTATAHASSAVGRSSSSVRSSC